MARATRKFLPGWFLGLLVSGAVFGVYAAAWQLGLLKSEEPADPTPQSGVADAAAVAETDPLEITDNFEPGIVDSPEVAAASYTRPLDLLENGSSSSRTRSQQTARRAQSLDNLSIETIPSRASGIRTVAFEDEVPAPIDTAAREKTTARPASEKVPVKSSSAKSKVAAGLIDVEEDGKSLPLMEMPKINALMDEGDYVAAQKELSRWYWQRPDKRESIKKSLNEMAQALFFAPQPHYYEPYVVKPGDQLRTVGQRYKLSWEYISRLNHVDAKKIRAGQKLKVLPGPFSAIVLLNNYELIVHLHGTFVKSYRVGVGKDGTTPLGTFAVKNKMVDPTYYGPEGVIGHDDPQNPLGERWIDIGDGYGIHGTIEPQTIGKNESRGCVRMLNSDVEEVYDFLVIGSEVKIQK